MKRLICMILALLLTLSALTALAMDGDGHLESDEEQGYRYGFAAEDRVMLAGQDALYEWRPGEAEALRYDYELPELEENLLATVFPSRRAAGSTPSVWWRDSTRTAETTWTTVTRRSTNCP